jgi:hypothetical protein
MVNIHTLYVLMTGERCTRYDRQITGDCSSFYLRDFFVLFFSLHDIRRKYSINNNLECPFVYIDIHV